MLISVVILLLGVCILRFSEAEAQQQSESQQGSYQIIVVPSKYELDDPAASRFMDEVLQSMLTRLRDYDRLNVVVVLERLDQRMRFEALFHPRRPKLLTVA